MNVSDLFLCVDMAEFRETDYNQIVKDVFERASTHLSDDESNKSSYLSDICVNIFNCSKKIHNEKEAADLRHFAQELKGNKQISSLIEFSGETHTVAEMIRGVVERILKGDSVDVGNEMMKVAREERGKIFSAYPSFGTRTDLRIAAKQIEARVAMAAKGEDSSKNLAGLKEEEKVLFDKNQTTIKELFPREGDMPHAFVVDLKKMYVEELAKEMGKQQQQMFSFTKCEEILSEVLTKIASEK